MTDRPLRPETITAQLDHYLDEATGGVVPPLQPSTTFARDEAYALHNPDNTYSRYGAPVHRLAEDILTRLEGGTDALLFSSGMAAIAALGRTVRTGGTILLQEGIYHGTTVWMRNFCERRAVRLVTVDALDGDALSAAIRSEKPDLVLLETPSNPWIGLVDIKRAADEAHAVGAELAIDSTAATPILSRPLSFGADYVLHSATKSLNGHSDVLAGALIAARETERWAAIRADRNLAGAMLGPFEAWLLLRGMRTMALRIERASANALAVARFLDGHDRVALVRYPGLQSHPHHSLARTQMPGGFGCLMSFDITGDGADALAVAGRLKTIIRATSLGGVESVIEHRHTIEKDLGTGVPETMLRLSVGIEHSDDLIADLEQALIPTE
ncbi:trans-sulfuration enzyme family protein [Coralliovum pocilloporae]|uniref:trans-sulfuration enzyme family protein n=1 Tax=Coralliovum pocilloporae TaxID=3066369 RepID=UPI003306C8A2